MELTQLRYFLDAAQTQHLTRSAENLHIAQPSLTKTIHNLEDELGVPLFIHKGRNIVLSEYGKFLQAKLEPIIKELDSLQGDLEEMVKGQKETIRLNVLAASGFLTDIIVEYKKSHPQVRFEFLQNTPHDTFDIQITTVGATQKAAKKNEENSFYLHENIYIAVPATEKYKNKKKIDLSELEKEEFVSLSSVREFRSICDGLCRQMGFKPNIVFESDSPVAVKNMISANTGVGFWPRYTWGTITEENVLLLPLENPNAARDIVFTKNSTPSPAAVKFFEFIKEYCNRTTNR